MVEALPRLRCTAGFYVGPRANRVFVTRYAIDLVRSIEHRVDGVVVVVVVAVLCVVKSVGVVLDVDDCSRPERCLVVLQHNWTFVTDGAPIRWYPCALQTRVGLS